MVDSKGRKFDIPVAVGVLAASRDIYRTGIGCELDEIEATWSHATANPLIQLKLTAHRAKKLFGTVEISILKGRD